MRPFHLAFPVNDLEKTREFYTNALRCDVGRSSERWIDFDMYGHQVVAHLVDNVSTAQTNLVDGDNVPAGHFDASYPAARSLAATHSSSASVMARVPILA